MTDRHKTKKRRIMPAVASLNRTSKSLSVTRDSSLRANNLQTPSRGKFYQQYARPNRISSPDLGVASTPQSDSQTIIISDSDDAQIIERSPQKRKRKHSTIRADSEDENNSSSDGGSNAKVGKGKGKARLEDDSGSDGGKDKYFDADTEDSDLEEGTEKTAGPSTNSSGGVKVKVKIGAPKKGNKVVPVYDNKVLKGHVKVCVLNACKLEHAHEAGTLVPRFDLEWKDWKWPLLKIIRDRAQLDPQCPDWVLSANEEDIRKAIKDGIHATMKTAWKKHQTGNGEAWLTGRRNSSRQWARKKQKATNRMTALIASGLDVNSSKFIANPNFVSDEEDDPGVEGCRVVKVPEYRTDDVTELAGALDVAFNPCLWCDQAGDAIAIA
ncbi:hypothetical protein FRC11_001711, partial [Ceratobasidium sp. 423]